jgi:hypothetical protein
MITVSIIATDEGTHDTDVITFTADERNCRTLLYAYCSGVQARTKIVLVSGHANAIGTAGGMIRKSPNCLNTALNRFIDEATEQGE